MYFILYLRANGILDHISDDAVKYLSTIITNQLL